MKLNLCVSLMIGLGISLIANVKAYAANFNFIQIAQINNPTSLPVINNAGTVAFSGTLDNGVQGIFTSDGSRIITIANVGETYSRFSDFSINDAGTVAFYALLNDGGYVTIPDTPIVIVPGNGIFTSNGTTTLPIRVIPRMETYAGFGTFLYSPSINNTGNVVYLEYQRPVSFIRTSDGRTIFGLTGFPILAQPLINDSGNIAYIDGIANSVVINDGTTDTVIASLSNDFSGIGGISFNNLGTVAFSASNVVGSDSPLGSWILTSNGTEETTIADTSGSFNSLFSPAINDQGTVVFQAELDTSGEGIFIGSDPLKDKVIATGDQLLGSIVTNIGFSEGGLNNSGQITFFATLANGTSGIFLADPQSTQPQPVSEPTHKLAILAFGVLAASSILKIKTNQ